MKVQVRESALGAVVPQFLLNFNGDSLLQNYFRLVLKTNYQKGVVKLDVGHCQSCCLVLTGNDRPRTKPSQPKTKKLGKLLKRSTVENLGQCHAYQVKKFLKSSVMLTVRCPSCGFMNKTPVISNEEKMAVKARLLKSVETDTGVTPIVTKKRRKRKQKQKDENCGLKIPGNKCDPDKSATDEITPLPMEVSEQSGPSLGLFSTPLNTNRQAPMSWALSASANRSTSAQNHVPKGTFSTPKYRMMPGGSRSNFQHRTSQQKGSTSIPTNRTMKRKQLQKFLSQEPTATTKTASLADFLSSL